MKLIKWLVIALALLLATVAAGGYFLPASVQVERSIVVERDAALIYPLLNGFEHFNSWSPWYGRDPQTVYRFEGPASGVGATMHWHSDDPNVGAGTQTITGGQLNQRVDIALDFGSQGQSVSWYELTPSDTNTPGANTKVTWGFRDDYGMNPFARYLGLMMDDWLGPDYETGLAKLKTYVESLPQ